jgi:hypothetical protein
VIQNIDIDALNECVENVVSLLKDGLVSTDIWVARDGLPLAGYNQQPAAVGLFTQLTDELQRTLSDSGFPGLKRYFMLDLEGDHTAMVIRHGEEVLQLFLLNNKKVNMGVLISVAVPRSIEQVGRAISCV